MNNLPLVSICCLTFNHGIYLEKTFQSFLGQKTNFRFEVLIHDDASTDNSRQIINNYCDKYPDVFLSVIQAENLYSKGGRAFTSRFLFPKAKGSYIALCDGDDFWTDPLKLQKQVDFLEDHPEYYFSFHKANIQSGDKIIGVRPKGGSGVLVMDDLLFRKSYATMSLVFRNYNGLIEEQLRLAPYFFAGDFPLVLSLASRGPGYLFPEVMGVYRVHPGGVYSPLGEIKKLKMGIQNRRAALDHIPMNFKQKMICRLMIMLRQVKILWLKLKGLFKKG